MCIRDRSGGVATAREVTRSELGVVRQAELIRFLVLAAQREGSRRLTRELRAIGLTPSQSEVLRILADHGPLSLTGLGELLVCESGTSPSPVRDNGPWSARIRR